MKVYLIGFMGSGKTHWGRELGEKLTLPFFDLDEKIAEREGRSVLDIFNLKGEEYFREQEKETLYMISESRESFIMATGGGTPCYFNNIDYMKRQGTVVWLNASMENLYQRLLDERDNRPLVAGMNDSQLRSYIVRKFSNRKIFYQQANIIINEEDLNMEALVNKIFHS